MPNNLVKNQEILLSIKRVGINGEGIGYYKRLAVFVPFALPGEEAVVRITEVHDQYAKAQLVRVKGDESIHRVEPLCPYFKSCGGCQLMHVKYEQQLKMKKDIVMESFSKYYNGDLKPNIFKDTIGMENPYYYRNKVKLPVRYDGEKLVTGLYEYDSNRLVYIDKCLIEREDLRKAVDEICAFLTKHQVICYNPKLKDGVLRHLVLRSSKLTKEIQVTAILYKYDQRTINIFKDIINIENVVSVYYTINDDLEAVENFGEEMVKIAGVDTITEEICGYKYKLLPSAFFQLNLEQTEKLYQEVINLSKFKGYEKVLDAYSGVGTIGLSVSKYVKEVRGIDNNKQAIINAQANYKENGITNAKYFYGDILHYLTKWQKTEEFTPDVMIVDPPRTGMELRLLNYLQSNPVKKLIYVSCNPATLAKNCNHLQKKYHINTIQVLDMFPHTANVECIAILTRR